MKLQYKAASMMIILQIVIILILSIVFDFYNHKVVLQNEIINRNALSKEIAEHMESHIIEKNLISATISSAPIIKETLLKSNSHYNSLSKEQRQKEIATLNSQWIRSDESNSFIQSYLTNPVAQYFKLQQELNPDEFGEIFLTNKYGAMIASTAKLTTLAHSHKYWWQESFNNGEGKTFIDDRGFDASVDGYVLGIVIPIKENGEIIGILKSNVKIAGSLTDLITNFYEQNTGMLQIARSNGDVVAEHGFLPFSTTVNKLIIPLLKQDKISSSIIEDTNKKKIVVTTPIPITLGSKDVGFGGKPESIDHIKGNRGDAWHIVLSIDTNESLKSAHKAYKIIILILVIFTLLSTIVAMFFGKLIAKPIVKLVEDVRSIGDGNFETKAEVSSSDEIGALAKSFNETTDKLRSSRNSLEKSNKELQTALSNVRTLTGLIPICSECKSVRDDKGYWNSLEEYIASNSTASLSHCICTDCADKLYGDKDWYEKFKEETN
jgi:methyl-accepting chemotaxis protein